MTSCSSSGGSSAASCSVWVALQCLFRDSIAFLRVKYLQSLFLWKETLFPFPFSPPDAPLLLRNDGIDRSYSVHTILFKETISSKIIVKNRQHLPRKWEIFLILNYPLIFVEKVIFWLYSKKEPWILHSSIKTYTNFLSYKNSSVITILYKRSFKATKNVS